MTGQHPESCDPTVFPGGLMIPNGAVFPPLHPNTTLWLWDTLPRPLLLLSTQTSPTPSLAANSHTRGAPKSPLFPHRFLCQIWEPRAIFFLDSDGASAPGTLLGGEGLGEVSPSWALTLHASLSQCPRHVQDLFQVSLPNSSLFIGQCLRAELAGI